MHRNCLRHAALLHGHAVNRVRSRDGPLVVRDDDELRFAHEFLQQIREAPDIRFIEGRVQLVEHAERRWFHHVEGEEQGHGREGLLPA